MAELTPNYSLKKPNADGSEIADLRVFVGENMSIIDTQLVNKINKDGTGKVAPTDLPTATGSVKGAVAVGNGLMLSEEWILARLGGGLEFDTGALNAIRVKAGTGITINGTTGALEASGGSSYTKDTISSFSATSNVSQTMGAGAIVLLKFGSVQYDNLGNYSASTGEFTAPSAGIYYFTGCMRLNTTLATQIFLAFYKNGVADTRVQQFMNGAGTPTATSNTSAPAQAHGNVIMKLNAGDKITVYGYSSVASSTQGIEALAFDTTFFRGIKLI